MQAGARTRLFRAIVGLGLAACGGMTRGAAEDAGSDAAPGDAAVLDARGATDATDASDAESSSDVALFGHDGGTMDAAADTGVDATDASRDADADADAFIVPVQ